jgi:hypothetical protein
MPIHGKGRGGSARGMAERVGDLAGRLAAIVEWCVEHERGHSRIPAGESTRNVARTTKAAALKGAAASGSGAWGSVPAVITALPGRPGQADYAGAAAAVTVSQ